MGGFGSPHGDLPVYVKSVFSKVRGHSTYQGHQPIRVTDSHDIMTRGPAQLRKVVPMFQGAAATDGRLKRGDQVLAVNGESLQGATHEQAVAILKRQRGTVTLDVLS